MPEQKHRAGAKYERNQGKYEHNFLFAPTAKLKMMMDRRHFENTFAMCCFEIGYLDHNGQYLNQIEEFRTKI